MSGEQRVLGYANASVETCARWWHEPAIVPVCVVASGVVAGVTQFANATICPDLPEYFAPAQEAITASMAGAGCGLIVSFVLMTIHALRPLSAARFRAVVDAVALGVVIAVIFWLVGGIAGAGLHAIAPGWVPLYSIASGGSGPANVHAWAFVVCSDYGRWIGSILATVAAAVSLSRSRRGTVARASGT